MLRRLVGQLVVEKDVEERRARERLSKNQNLSDDYINRYWIKVRKRRERR